MSSTWEADYCACQELQVALFTSLWCVDVVSMSDCRHDTHSKLRHSEIRPFNFPSVISSPPSLTQSDAEVGTPQCQNMSACLLNNPQRHRHALSQQFRFCSFLQGKLLPCESRLCTVFPSAGANPEEGYIDKLDGPCRGCRGVGGGIQPRSHP